MTTQRRRGCTPFLLFCCVTLIVASTFVVVGIKNRRFFTSLPAEIVDIGPIWVGDFCRDNVAHKRYPPGWCPHDYTLYVIFRAGDRGLIYPITSIPSNIPDRRVSN